MKKRMMTAVLAVLMITAFFAGCGKKSAANAAFTDLRSGMTKEEIVSVLGRGYSETDAPKRIIYQNLSLLGDAVKGKETKLSCFFADDDKAYLIAYYIYGTAEADYNSVKAALSEQYGESAAGENEATIQWVLPDESTVTLTDAGDYLAVGLYGKQIVDESLE